MIILINNRIQSNNSLLLEVYKYQEFAQKSTLKAILLH